jgi:hypothetical protein
MRSQPKNHKSQPTVPDCTDLVKLEQRRGETRALKQAMMQELLTGMTKLV